MARKRVDTQFVIILAAVLTLAAGSVAGAYLYFRWQNNDPTYLQGRAEAALAKGDVAQAIDYYGRAGEKGKDPKVRAQNFLKYAELSMKTAEGALGARNYREALKGWSRTLEVEPTNVEAGDALMREIYTMVRTSLDMVAPPPFDDKLNLSSDPQRTFVPLLGFWGAKANAVATARPEHGLGRALRGWWNMRRLMELNNWVKAPEADLKSIKDDYEAAIKLSPDEPAGYLLGCEFELRRADLYTPDKLVERRKAQAAAIKMVETYVDRHPEDLDVLPDLIYLKLWYGATKDELAALYQRAIDVNAKAKADPKNPRTNPRLAAIIWNMAVRLQKQADAEQFLKAAVDANPSDGLARWRLALYYEGLNRWEEEVKILKAIHEPAETGRGLDALINDELRTIALEELPRINLLIAAREKSSGGLASEKGKNAMNAAQEQIKVLRGKAPLDVWVAILDGRRAFLEGSFSALDALRQADERTGANERSVSQRAKWRNFRTSKLYLAEAYAARRDETKAIEKYTELLDAVKNSGRQDDVYARLQRAELYKSTKQWKQMIDDYQDLNKTLGDEPSLIERWADGLLKMGAPKEAEYLLANRAAPEKQVMGIVVRGLQELMENRLEKALATADEVLTKHPNNAEGRFLKVRVLRAMNESERALRLLAELVQEYPQREDFRRLQIVLTMPEASEEEIQQKFVESIQDEPRKSKSRIGMFFLAGKIDEALKAIAEAETRWPDDPDLIDLKFRLLLVKKDYNEAARYATKAKGMNLDQANGLLFEGQLDMAKAGGDQELRTRALKKIEDAVLRAKDYYAAHAALGDAYLSFRRVDDAMKQYEETIRLKSDSVRELKLMVQLLSERHGDMDKQRARDYLRRALQVAPTDRQLREFEDELGDLDKVLARREEQHRRFKDDLENTQRLAALYMKRSAQARNAQERAADVEKALALVAEVTGKAKSLRVAHWAAGFYRDAGQTKQAVDLYYPFMASEDPKVKDAARLALGRMYRSMNMPEDAARVFADLAQSPAAPTPTPGEGHAASEARKDLADMLFDLERMPEAEAAYRGVEEKLGKSTKVSLRLCETLLNQGKFQEADQRLQELAAAEPSNLEVMSLTGYSALLQKKLPEASAKFAQVLGTDPNNVNALHFRAVAEYSRPGGSLKQAMDDLQQVKEALRSRGLGPNAKIESRLLLARIYRVLRKYPEAVREYREIAELDRTESNANLTGIRAEYVAYLGQLAENARNLPPDVRGFPWMDDLRAVRPADALAEALQKLMALPPKVPVWWLRYADLMIAEEKPGQAVTMMKQAAATWPEERGVMAVYLNALVRDKRWSEAVEVANGMITKWPDFAEAYALRAAAGYGKSPSTPQVRTDVEKAIELTTDLRMAYARGQHLSADTNAQLVTSVIESRLQKDGAIPFRFAIAGVLMAENRPGDVAEKLQPALADPAMKLDANRPAKMHVLRTLGDVSLRSGKFREAVGFYDQVLAIDGNDIESLNNNAYIHAEELHNPDQGLPLAQRAVETMRQRPAMSVLASQGNVLDTYGWILYRVAEKLPAGDAGARAKFDEARRNLEQARDAEPSPLVYLHLSQTYDKLGMPDEARRSADQGLMLARAKKDPLERELETVSRRLREKK